MRKSLLIATAATTIALAGIVGVGLVSAATDTTSGTLVDKLVAKFHLNKSDVQQVFDQQRSQNQAAHQAEEKTRLDQAVKDGKLTQAQEDKIIAHEAEEKTLMDSLAGKTEAERHTAMEANRTAEQKWAKGNGIPAEFLRGPDGHGGHRGGGWGGSDSDAPEATSATSTK